MNSWELTLFDQLDSTKWKERQAALDTILQEISSNPHFSPNSVLLDHKLIGKLNHIISGDTNIVVVAQAISCLTRIIQGHGVNFSAYVSSIAPVIFEKFKEKKLKDPLVDCINALYTVSNFEQLLPAIQEAIVKANPNIKTQLDLFLYRAFRTLSAPKIANCALKDLVAALDKHTGDPLPEVRDAACSTLGALANCIGDVTFNSLISSELANDRTKMNKICEAKKISKAEAVAEEAKNHDYNQTNEIGCTNASATDEQNSESEQKRIDEDIWESIEPVDIGPKIALNFEELIISKKWQERKEALDALHAILIANRRLAPNPRYFHLINRLNNILSTDSNINIAAMAAKCLCAFAAGMRNAFAPYACAVVSLVFEKFKEKKPLLRDPLIECIDSVYASTNFATISPKIVDAFAKTNPNQKVQLDQFLYRVFRSLDAKDISTEMLRDLSAGLIKHAYDSDPEVRDSSYAALGAIQKCIGERAFAAMLSSELGSDRSKIAKIMDYRNKALAEAPPPKVTVIASSNATPRPSAQPNPQTKKNIPSLPESRHIIAKTASAKEVKPLRLSTAANGRASIAANGKASRPSTQPNPQTDKNVVQSRKRDVFPPAMTQFHFEQIDTPSGSRIPRLIRKQ